MTVRTVVFDMDGTLVQTRAASWEVFQDTAREFDLPVRNAEDFFALFRGNFFESLAKVCGDRARTDAVREHFMTGLKQRYQPEFIPGMVDVIKALAPHFALAVMSSNSMDAIRRILEKAGVAQCFAHVFSAEVGTSKREHLRKVQIDPGYAGVRQCSPDYLEGGRVEPGSGPSEVVLITDTVGDIGEATGCGARAIGVSWGMHGAEALLAAGAERVVYWPQEIVAVLLPAGLGSACATCVVAAPPGGAAITAQLPGQLARLGRDRHARRTSGVLSHCRCGKQCGIGDAVHSCGARPAAAQIDTVVGYRPPPNGQLVAAIARIASRAP